MRKNRSVPITDEVRVLRYLRVQAGLSLKKAGKKLNMTDGAISHIENGKMRLPLERIEPMVLAYGQTMAEFFKLSRARSVPTTCRQDCEKLLKTVPNARLNDLFEFMKSLIEGVKS